MRHLYIFTILGLLARLAAAQTPVVADSGQTVEAQPLPDERWVRSKTDTTGECTEVLHWSGRGGLVRVFHPSGQLKQHIPYADLAAGHLHGVLTTWYDDGQLAARQTFVQGKREGELLLYYPDGQLKRQTHYEAGNELLGNCFDPAGTPVVYFPYEQPPLYPGGQPQLVKEITTALRRWRPTGPIQLVKAQLHVSFTINEQGSVVNPQAALTDEKVAVLPMLGSQISQTSWQTTLEQLVKPLLAKAQQAVTQLTKSFYPGQRDGTTISWQYTLTIPLDYGGSAPPAGIIRRRGTNFGL